jgi:hypothetical protein
MSTYLWIGRGSIVGMVGLPDPVRGQANPRWALAAKASSLLRVLPGILLIHEAK